MQNEKFACDYWILSQLANGSRAFTTGVHRHTQQYTDLVASQFVLRPQKTINRFNILPSKPMEKSFLKKKKKERKVLEMNYTNNSTLRRIVDVIRAGLETVNEEVSSRQ